jgi:hypothetical protein
LLPAVTPDRPHDRLKIKNPKAPLRGARCTGRMLTPREITLSLEQARHIGELCRGGR